VGLFLWASWVVWGKDRLQSEYDTLKDSVRKQDELNGEDLLRRHEERVRAWRARSSLCGGTDNVD
jgi:hypothetical protein